MREIERIGQFQNVHHMELRQKIITGNNDFSEIIAQKFEETKGVQFSKHAAQRAVQRGINLTEDDLKVLNQAVDKAREKGARDVAVIGINRTFIVNVPNNIVITALAGDEIKENIFTNIDSAVVI